MTGGHSVDDSQSHRYKGKQCHHWQPYLQARVTPQETGVFPIVHGQDDRGGAEEELHVAHEVPSLANAEITSGNVCYVQYCVPPSNLARSSDT